MILWGDYIKTENLHINCESALRHVGSDCEPTENDSQFLLQLHDEEPLENDLLVLL
jgi:hypothetical protein